MTTSATVPADTDFVISQGTSLPIMRIPIPANSEGELPDLSGCTVTFSGRKDGERTWPPPIQREIERWAIEGDEVAVYVHLTADDTRAIPTPANSYYQKMQGELKIVDNATGDSLSIPNLNDDDPALPYVTWWIRDAIIDEVS